MSYKSRLSKTKEQIAEGTLTLAAAEGKAQLNAIIADSDLQILRLTPALEAAKGANPYSFDKVYKITNEVAEIEAKKAAAQAELNNEFAD